MRSEASMRIRDNWVSAVAGRQVGEFGREERLGEGRKHTGGREQGGERWEWGRGGGFVGFLMADHRGNFTFRGRGSWPRAIRARFRSRAQTD